MQVSINGITCLVGSITEQQSGNWTARVEVDAEDASKIKSPISLKVGTESFVGVVVVGGVPEGQGRWVGHIVGGKGNLDKVISAKDYSNSSLSSIVRDAVSEAGETLNSTETESAALSSERKTKWVRIRGETRYALAAIAADLGGFWRVNRAGEIVFRKTETWAKSTFSFEYIDADPSDGTIEIAPLDSPGARPGLSIDGNKAVEVLTVWSSAGVRQKITVEVEGKARGAAASHISIIRRVVESPVNYSQWYAAKIIQQDADGTLHLLPDDDRVKGTGLTKVPLKTGIPGLSVKVQPGTYVRLFFEGGSPDAPCAALSDHASGVLEIMLESQIKCTIAAPQLLLGPSASPPPNQSMLLGENEHAYLDAICQAISTSLKLITPGPASSGGAPASAAFDAFIQALATAKQLALSPTTKVG